jgi:hypothetical protein
MAQNSVIHISANTSESNGDQLSIKEIDLPLYKYGLMFRHDINGYFDDYIKRRKQKIKSFALTVWLLFCFLHFLICLLSVKNGRVPDYYFDVIQYVGGITEYFYAMGINGLILSLVVIILLNKKEINYFRWLDIIKVLKGIKSMNAIKIHDKNVHKIFVHKINYLLILAKISIKINVLFLVLVSITSLYLFYDLKDMLIYGILSAVKFSLFFISMIVAISYGFVYYFIVCYYCKLRFKSFNDKVMKTIISRLFYTRKKFKVLAEEHNSICNDINLHNKFWKYYSFAITYTLIPTNLMTLQQVFFEDIMIPILILAIIFLVVFLSSQVMLNSITASVNSEASNSYKILIRLYLDSSSYMKLKDRIKVEQN